MATTHRMVTRGVSASSRGSPSLRKTACDAKAAPSARISVRRAARRVTTCMNRPTDHLLMRSRVHHPHSLLRNPPRFLSGRKHAKSSGAAASLPVDGCEYIEDVVEQLSRGLLEKSLANPAKRYIIGIAGPPGGGKSTLAALVRDTINKLAADETSEAGESPAVMVPMDGFHLYRKELDAMDDPDEAHARRGAHWTFDAEAFVNCIHSLAEQSDSTVSIPSFDHAVGDPVPGDIQVSPDKSIVLVEGNYLLLDMEPWQRLGDAFDETWFVDTPIDEAMERIFQRQTRIGLDPEASRLRIAANDKPNAEAVLATRARAGLVVPPLPFRGTSSPTSSSNSSSSIA